MNRVELAKLMGEYGLSRVAEPLMALTRDCIALSRTPCAGHDVPVGSSKFGGAADLPPAPHWPERDGIPYSLIAQIDCAAAATCDPTGLLPKTGLLSIFLLLAVEECLDFPLLLYHDTRMLQRLPIPTWPDGMKATASSFFPELVLPTCKVTFTRSVTLASPFSQRLATVGLTDEERRQYWELSQLLGPSNFFWSSKQSGFVYPPLGSPEDRPGHQMFGNPFAIQWEPYAPDGPDGWQILLQFASDFHARFCWGDLGVLTWCIRAEDLRRRAFERAQFTVDMS